MLLMDNSFIRTASGINNSRHFFNVDIVLYCEGGDGDYSLEDILENKYCDNSNDILFWEKVFKKFKPDIKIKIKSIGANSVVNDIKNHILDNDIQHSYVARDRDYKHMNIGLYSVSNIELVTYGYSWENDVWNIESALKIYCTLTHTQLNNNIKDQIQVLLRKFERKLSKIITLDINLATYYNESAFQKNSKKCCARFIKQKGEPVPILTEFLKDGKLLRGRLNSRITFDYYVNSDFLVDCQGHLLAEIYYRIIVYLVQKKIRKRKIEKEIVYAMVINELFESHSYIYQHYQEMLNKIPI